MIKIALLTCGLCVWTVDANAQNLVSAIVIDIGGKKPVPLASVYVSDQTNTSYHGTITDQNGKFKLQVIKKSDTIRISCVGYVTKKITGKSIITMDTILLEESAGMLPEFIVRSVSAKDYIKACILKIPQNYIGKRFINYGTFWQSLKTVDSYQYFYQASIVMNSLFQLRSISNTIHLNPEIRIYTDTTHGIIPLYRDPKSILYFDLIRTGASILSTTDLDNWEFSYSILSSESLVVIEAITHGDLSNFVFYILPESLAFRKIEYEYRWPPVKKVRIAEDKFGLPLHSMDSLVYVVTSVKGVIQYEKTFEKYNLKYFWNEVSYEILSNMNDLRLPVKSAPYLLVTEVVVTDSYEYGLEQKYSILQPYSAIPNIVNDEEFKKAKRALIDLNNH